MAILKQSTTYTRAFLLVQSSDHVTGLTGASATVTISKAGGSFASAGGTVTEIANGWYKIALTTTDTSTLGDLAYHVSASSADPTDFVDQVTSLILGDAVALQADQAVNVTKVNGTSQTARDLGASVLISSGTGTGQLDVTSGVIKSNLAQILGTALTETAGQIAAAFKQFFNIASPTSTMNAITAVTTATNLTNAPTSGDFTAAMKTSLNAATPAVTVSDKTGFALTSAYDAAKTAAQASDIPSASTIAQAVWDALTSALTTVGSIGKLLVDNIDAAISTRSTYAGGDTSGTTTLLGRLTSTRAGLLDNLDAAISGRLAAADYIAPDNTSITAIKASTDNLPASPAAVGDAMTLTTGERDAVAAAHLDLADGVETGLTVRQQLRLAAATLFGKLSGAATTAVAIRDTGDTKNRITAVVDASGNRTSVTLDAS